MSSARVAFAGRTNRLPAASSQGWWVALQLLLGLCLSLLVAASALAQQQAIPQLEQRITDTTATLDDQTVSRLTQALAQLEQTKGAQIAVLMVPTIGQEAIEQYSMRAFEQWQLGREGVDDGILFVIAKDDRRLRIEVGYGLEGAVPDLLAGRIIREQVAPRFQQGDFSGGVEAGVNSLILLVEGEDLPAPVKPVEEPASLGILDFIIMAVIATMLSPAIAAFGVLVFVLINTGSLVFAVLGAMVALLLSLAARSYFPAGHGARVSRQGGVIGGLGGLSHRPGGFGGGIGRGGGFGGGGFGGGGGMGGGGGASGSW